MLRFSSQSRVQWGVGWLDLVCAVRRDRFVFLVEEVHGVTVNAAVVHHAAWTVPKDEKEIKAHKTLLAYLKGLLGVLTRLNQLRKLEN